jgi:hypothetical protein
MQPISRSLLWLWIAALGVAVGACDSGRATPLSRSPSRIGHERAVPAGNLPAPVSDRRYDQNLQTDETRPTR